jgi:formamidopyrimidine-DNA glycosylase
MPELPEVELVRRRMQGAMPGLRIDKVTVHDDAILEGISRTALVAALTGRSIATVLRRGKQLMCLLDDGTALTLHLGMTGDVEIADRMIDDKHLRFSLLLSNGTWMHFIDQRKFGAIGHFPSPEEVIMAKHLGPDALEISSKIFSEKISKHRKAIKTSLLDQGVLAGVGNLYSDEMLYQCRIHPEERADMLSARQLKCLYRAMRDILQRSIDNGSDFDLLDERYMLRDRRAGGSCPRCGSQWQTVVVNGRTAFICPKCQKAPHLHPKTK